MSEKTLKCPMCGLPKETKCDLMVGKDAKGASICCCTRLEKKSINKT